MRTRREEGENGGRLRVGDGAPNLWDAAKWTRKRKPKKTKKRREMRVVKIHAGGKRREKQKFGEGGKEREKWMAARDARGRLEGGDQRKKSLTFSPPLPLQNSAIKIREIFTLDTCSKTEKSSFWKTNFFATCAKAWMKQIVLKFSVLVRSALSFCLFFTQAIQLATFQFKRLAREERKILPTEKMRGNRAPLKKKFSFPRPTFLLLQADLIYSADFRVNKLPHFFWLWGGGREGEKSGTSRVACVAQICNHLLPSPEEFMHFILFLNAFRISSPHTSCPQFFEAAVSYYMGGKRGRGLL